MTTREPRETIIRARGAQRVNVEQPRQLTQRTLGRVERLDIRSVHE
jgi:hypothetical protein